MFRKNNRIIRTRSLRTLLSGGILFFALNTGAYAHLKNNDAEKFFIIPIEFIDRKPLVTVEIEGKKAKLSLDTGSAKPISLSKDIIQTLKGIEYTNKYSSYTDATGKLHTAEIFNLKKARLGRYQATNIKGDEYTPWGVYLSDDGSSQHATEVTLPEEDKHGVIGLGFFNKKNLIIDFNRKKLIVLESRTLPADYNNIKWHSTPLSLSQDGLTLQATMNNHVGKFLVDTATTASLLKKNSPFFKKQDKEKTDIIVKNFSISEKEFGPIQFWFLDFSEPAVDGYLGYNFFFNNIVYLDFEKKLIHLSANLPPKEAPHEQS